MLGAVGKLSSASVVLFALLTLAGCASGAPEPSPSPSASASRSAEPSPTATPTPTDSAGAPSTAPSAPTAPAPAAPAPAPTEAQGGESPGDAAGSGTPLGARDAYLACQRGAAESAATTPDELSWAPFEDAYVVQAGDAWRVYIEYVRTPKDGSPTFDGAASCVLRGTVESPLPESLGAGLRGDPTTEAHWTPPSE
jgi:hypothetical protein